MGNLSWANETTNSEFFWLNVENHYYGVLAGIRKGHLLNTCRA
jgi:hypothetical protein